jgi:probable addiction module antidote protein
MNKKQKKKLSKYQGYNDFVAANLKNNPELADHYLKSAFKEYEKDGNERALLIVLRQIAQAKGMSQVAKGTGISRQALYKALSERGNPRFSTITSIIHSLGYNLTLRHIRT